VLEVPAPVDGVLKEITRPSGETVVSDELLAVIEEGEVEVDLRETEPTDAPSEPAPESATGATTGTADTSGLSPATRRIVEEEKIDPASVSA
ncbi:MAG: dihydrolipoamide succinyltransferase, partial [Xanthomonadales bacterium]|nr:dihydrolipoamide succinyltransferase [Xanthomonadales bacterium]NIX12774.1 dihydrolipoamide succinyltransferase [Xanthomonadales bacterium]